jgi:hypothetical protein
MAYWSSKSQNTTSANSFGLKGDNSAKSSEMEFYELEPAVVLDVIIDGNHPFLKSSTSAITIDADRWPGDVEGKKSNTKDIDYSWVGRALVRMVFSSPTTKKEQLVWAFPMDSSVSEYPLINEVVMVFKYQNKYFYHRKLNWRNLPNEGVDFSINRKISGVDNTELYSDVPYSGIESKANFAGSLGYKGVAGKYYKINNRMRRIQRYEGDLVVESRFGQSIKMGTYDGTRENDSGAKKRRLFRFGWKPDDYYPKPPKKNS